MVPWAYHGDMHEVAEVCEGMFRYRRVFMGYSWGTRGYMVFGGGSVSVVIDGWQLHTRVPGATHSFNAASVTLA